MRFSGAGIGFIRNISGATAPLFGLMLVLVLGTSGLALDFGMSSFTRSRMQAALDNAVLAASRATVPDEQRQAVFDQVFAANFPAARGVASTTFAYTKGEGSKATATMTRANHLVSVLGFRETQIGAASAASMESVDIEVVFVLDTSGSMAAGMSGGSRMNALKSAANKLIDTMTANKPAGKSVKFAVVPFTMAVNVGTDMINFVEGTGHALFSGTTWAGCVLERRGGYHHKDVYSSVAGDGSGKWHAYIWPPAPNSSNSCLNPSNGTNAGYQSVEAAPLGLDPWMMGPNFNCPRFPISPLSDDETKARASIDALVPTATWERPSAQPWAGA